MIVFTGESNLQPSKQRWARVPVGLRVSRACVPRFFLRFPRSRVPVRYFFHVAPRSRVPVFAFLRFYSSPLRLKVARSCRLNYGTMGGGGGDLVSSECCRAPNRSYASQNDVILHGYLWVTKEYIYQRIFILNTNSSF